MRVLIVEDEPYMAEAIRDGLRLEAIAADIAGDGDTALELLSINAYDTLLYGALAESASWLKKTAGIDNMGDEYEKRFVVGLQGLKNLGEARDRKDTYRSGEKRTAEQ